MGPFSSVTSLEMKNPAVICSGCSGAEKLLTPPIHRRWICAVLPGGLCGCLTRAAEHHAALRSPTGGENWGKKWNSWFEIKRVQLDGQSPRAFSEEVCAFERSCAWH